MKNALVPSRIPGVDYVLNPYVGCTFGCKFCYANYMAKAVGRRREEWGNFVIPKDGVLSALVRQLRNPWKYYGKYILIGSATDPYQPAEAQLKLTRRLLTIFLKLAPNVNVGILTRSPLVVRDADLLRRLKVEVGISVSVMREDYFREVEPVSPPFHVRLNVLKYLRERGVEPYVFLAPIFPDAYETLGHILKDLKILGFNLRYAEMLSPFKNPSLRRLKQFQGWVELQRKRGIYGRFSALIRSFYSDAHIIRHGWK